MKIKIWKERNKKFICENNIKNTKQLQLETVLLQKVAELVLSQAVFSKRSDSAIPVALVCSNKLSSWGVAKLARTYFKVQPSIWYILNDEEYADFRAL